MVSPAGLNSNTKRLLSSGISMRNVRRSPIRTVSTSRLRVSKIRILGGGASGDELM